MERLIFFSFPVLSLIADLVVLNIFFFDTYGQEREIENFSLFLVIVGLLNIFWIILFIFFRLSEMPRLIQRKKIIWNSLIALLFWFFLYLILNLLSGNSILITFRLFRTFFLAALIVSAFKLLFDFLIRFVRSHGLNNMNILIIGYNEKAEELRNYMENNAWTGYQFTGYIHEGDCPAPCLSNSYSTIEQMVTLNKIDEVFVNMKIIPEEVKQSILNLANQKKIRISLLLDFAVFPAFYHNYQRFDRFPVISIGKDNLSVSINYLTKRSFDILVSILVIVLFMSWAMPLISLFIILDSKGPVLFRQQRTGYKNKTFTCLKFRTMVNNPDSDSVQASEDDARITTSGKILRKSSLDETPQFFNVLAGQMSVVGPRPHMLKHTEEYSKVITDYLKRHSYKPGITGLAQIRGHRGETKQLEKMKARVEFDIYYTENWSFWLDLKIILITLKQLLQGNMSGN